MIFWKFKRTGTIIEQVIVTSSGCQQVYVCG